MMNTEIAKPSAIERCQTKLGELKRRFWAQVAGTALAGTFAAAGVSVALVEGIEGVSNLSAAAPSVQVESTSAGDFIDERKPLLTMERKDDSVVERHLSDAGNNAAIVVTAGESGLYLQQGHWLLDLPLAGRAGKLNLFRMHLSITANKRRVHVHVTSYKSLEGQNVLVLSEGL